MRDAVTCLSSRQPCWPSAAQVRLVASVVMAYGINANLVRKWRRLAQRKVVATGIYAEIR